MQLKRLLNLKQLLKKKSFFLFGPRATGKTNLIQQQLSNNALIINLLRTDIFQRLMNEPWQVENMINARTPQQQIIVIDEIQKIPILLNEIHRLIEEQHLTFLLTGSSARKLRHRHVNLLAGRAWEAHLYPLTMSEIPNFSLERYLTFGGLPAVYLSENPHEELMAYVDTYLKEEIQMESFVRKLQSFTRFLYVSALTSGKIINFNSLASDVGIPASTVREYYQILQDTLVGFILPAWTKTQKRKAISTAKFYFFDIGVRHQLMNIHSVPHQSDLYGQAFEHFMAMELTAFLSYHRLSLTLSYWQAQYGQEVDFIIGDDIAIEIKTSQSITKKHMKGLKALQEEKICKHYYLVSFDPIQQIYEGIICMDWKTFLTKLWQKEII